MDQNAAIELVKAFLGALDNRDGTALAALLTEEIVHDTGHGERVIGRNAVRDGLIARALALDETHGDIVAMVSQDGGRAAAEVTLRGSHGQPVEGLPAPSGKRYSLPAGFFFEIEQGKLLRVTRLFDQKALAAQLAGD